MEQQRRLEARLASATARHMSDAKWLALFKALHGVDVGAIRWKFVADERVFVQGTPSEAELLPDRLGDVLPAPYTPFREIEWVEVPAERDSLIGHLRASTKQFPWQESVGGLRLVAYEWHVGAIQTKLDQNVK
jgi:hypothetical protein